MLKKIYTYKNELIFVSLTIIREQLNRFVLIIEVTIIKVKYKGVDILIELIPTKLTFDFKRL